MGLVFISFITSRPAHSTAMPVLFLLSGPKMGLVFVSFIFVYFGCVQNVDKCLFWLSVLIE